MESPERSALLFYKNINSVFGSTGQKVVRHNNCFDGAMKLAKLVNSRVELNAMNLLIHCQSLIVVCLMQKSFIYDLR